jgi:hypothetical protein
MKQSTEAFFEKIDSLSTNERAAAIAHRIYMLTAERADWTTRVPEEWEELSDEARSYNLESIKTWVEEARLFDSWLQAVNELKAAQSIRKL